MPLTSSISLKYPLCKRGRSFGAAIAFALTVTVASAVQADQFSVVPATSFIYAQLGVLGRAGWLDDAYGTRAGGQRDVSQTRYEVSLQVARAIFSVAARQQADSAWAASISKNEARALHDLTQEFRVELTELGVDVAASQKRIEPLWRGKTQLTPVRKNAPRATPAAPASVAPASVALPVVVRRAALREDLRAPLSRNTFSALTADAGQVFGDAARANRRAVAGQGDRPSMPRAGVALGVNSWLALRAEYDRQKLTRPAAIPVLPSRTAAYALSRDMRSLRGGVDLSLWRGLKLSGDLENVTGQGSSASRSWTRLGGGIGWSGMQNRLSLKANMSRLVPENDSILPSTLVGLNLGLDVSDRMSLNLLYQAMFSAPSSGDPNRLVAGGVSINF